MAKKKVIKQDDKPISSKELKFWLKGILEFQSDNWVPNKEQWESIKNKIFKLVDSDTRSERNVNSNPIHYGPMPVYEEQIGEELMQFTGEGEVSEGGAPMVARNFQRPAPTVVSNPNGLQGDTRNSKATNDFSGNGYKSSFK